MCLMRCVDCIFDDKRVGILCLMTWLGIVMCLFYDVGLFKGQYMRLGPSPETIFMQTVLDTWYKWNMVALFTAVNTCINDFMSDSISPWLLNTVTDHKTKYLPYPKYQCLLISQFWSLYCGIMSIAGLMITLTQVDFVIIRLVCDLLVSIYTNMKFMRDKEYNPRKYYNLDVNLYTDDIELKETSKFTIDEVSNGH